MFARREIRNRETPRDTLSDSHDRMQSRKVTRQKSLFLFFLFFFYAKNQSDRYRRNDKSNSRSVLPVKKGIPKFFLSIFPCRFTDRGKGKFFSLPPNRTDRTKNNRRKIIWRACQLSVDINYPITRLKLKIWRFFTTLTDLFIVRDIDLNRVIEIVGKHFRQLVTQNSFSVNLVNLITFAVIFIGARADR